MVGATTAYVLPTREEPDGTAAVDVASSAGDALPFALPGNF